MPEVWQHSPSTAVEYVRLPGAEKILTIPPSLLQGADAVIQEEMCCFDVQKRDKAYDFH
jgi:hypothetical protein